MTIQATVCFILKKNEVLLLKKSRGLLGQGKWNAPGGKILQNEDPQACAFREVFEETQLIVEEIEPIGILYFYKNNQRRIPDWTVHAFLARQFKGEPTDGREGKLKWFNIDTLPLEDMWEDDQYWCRIAIGGTRLQGWFYYSGDFEKLIDHKIEAMSRPELIQP